MTRVLLTGAGFSRNWGGRLTSEVFNYLIACEGLDKPTKDLLWQARERRGNFETVLGELPPVARKAMLSELFSMFNEMNAAFTRTKFEPSDGDLAVRNFLVQFDAIFTLNQDLLLETHYLNDNIVLSGDSRWRNGWCMPGTEIKVSPHYDQVPWRQPVSDPNKLKIEPLSQPYFKLHGSSKWFDAAGGPMLILGGDKAGQIDRVPTLKWLHERFAEYLGRGDARLVVIGYGFGDDHINEIIARAAESSRLKIFINDPAGVGVLKKETGAAIPNPADRVWLDRLQSFITGASERSIRDILGGDEVERANFHRFLLS